MESLDVMDIKQHNVKSIVNVLRFSAGESGLTKRDIADRTALSFATVSNLCNELLERGIVEIVKKNSMSVGRTPSTVNLAYNRFCTVCLNLQMKGVLGIAVLNIRNEIVFHQKYDISGLDAPEEVIDYARKRFDEIARENSNHVYIGVGVAVSGIFDLATQTLVNCAVKMYEGVPLKAIVEKAFQLPGYVDNEANLCALSLNHTIAECRNLVYLHISEGVGVGIICEGSLLRGHHGYGGEVAHTPLGNPRKYCSECGAYGCIENELAIPDIVAEYWGEEQEDVLGAWNQLVADAKKEDEKAVHLIHETAGYLGRLISVLITMMDPEYIYIGGEITDIYEELFANMNQIVQERCFLYGNRRVKLVKDGHSELTIHSGINESIYAQWKP